MRNVYHVLCTLTLAACVFGRIPAGAQTPRLYPVTPQAGSGTSNETSYVPDVAGPGSTIVATFIDPESASGPSGQALIAFDDSRGHRTFFRATTDARHRLVFKAAAGSVAVWLFKSFTQEGKPDTAAVRTAISAADVEGTMPVAAVPAHGPAITRAATAYERGGLSRGLISVQTRGNDPVTSHVLVDGSSAYTDTVAASDRNVKALLHDAAPLGRHRISLASGNARSNSVPADIVALRADPVAPAETGSVQTLTVHVDGLPPRDFATMYFTVSGSARLESGAQTAQVPVRDGIAQVRIRGEHSGEALITFHLVAQLADTEAGGPPRTVAREGPGTSQRGPEQSPTPAPTPGDIEKPNIYGHDDLVPCSIRDVDGYMQPTQGIWQDDKAFPEFRVLERHRGYDYPEYTAPYPLIVQRPTLVAGVYHYKWVPDKSDVFPDDRDDPRGATKGHIVLSLWTNCNLKDRVRFNFTFGIYATKEWERNSEELGVVPLHGTVRPNARFIQYHVLLSAQRGYPRQEAAFAPSRAGPYVVTARLQRCPSEKSSALCASTSAWEDVPGVKMSVRGDVVKTQGPTVHFVPTILKHGDEFEDDLESQAQRLADDSSRLIPDLFPLKPGGDMKSSALPSVVNPENQPLDLSDSPLVTDAASVTGLKNRFDVSTALPDAISAALGARYSLQAMLENYDRMIVVLTGSDFELIKPGPRSAAFTQRNEGTGRKVIFVTMWSPWEDVAHELTHTLPWVDRDLGAADSDGPKWMISECAKGYHNVSKGQFAQGLHFIFAGKAGSKREIESGDTPGFMTGSTGRSEYIEQCTYRHLAHELQGRSDPPVLLVRGYLWSNGLRSWATFAHFYTIDSAVDDSRNLPNREFHVILRDAGGRELKNIAIFPVLHRMDYPADSGTPRRPALIDFFSRIQLPHGTVSVELRSTRSGLLAVKRLGAIAPVVTIGAPSLGRAMGATRVVNLRWQVSGPAAREPYVSSVLVSTNGGKTYLAESIEQAGTTLRFSLTRHRSYLVRVVTSNGGRSGEAQVRITP